MTRTYSVGASLVFISLFGNNGFIGHACPLMSLIL